MGIKLHKEGSCKECVDNKNNGCVCYKCINKEYGELMNGLSLCGCSSRVLWVSSNGMEHPSNTPTDPRSPDCKGYKEDWIKAIKNKYRG